MGIIVDNSISNNTRIVIWELKEELSTLKKLSTELPGNQIVKNKELLASRYAIRAALKETGYPTKIVYTKSGKPVIDNYKISISHSANYACFIISNKQNVAIDIECKHQKAWELRKRYMHTTELSYCESIHSAGIMWSAKECFIKLYDKKDVELRKMQTSIQHSGEISIETPYKVPFEAKFYWKQFGDLYLVWAIESNV